MMSDRDLSLQAQDESLSGVIGTRPGRFWVACSDSHINLFDPARNPSGLVHSNPGNLALTSDISFLASLKMAIDTFSVAEIVVCGHYGCRSIEAAASGVRNEILGDWLTPLRSLAGRYSGLQTASDGPGPPADALAELNVVEQTINVSRTSVVRDAWAAGRQLTIVGMIFDPANGSLSRVGEPIASAKLSNVM
jgi:carbonic anhydrase